MRRHHVVGLGVLGTLIGVYQFAAQVGVVPRNPVELLNYAPAALHNLENGQLPPLPGAHPATDAGGIYHTSGYGSPSYGGDIAVRFSPAGGCTEAVVAEINQARQQILVQAYSFTSVPIANALVAAHNHGVAVFVVLDKSQKSEQYSAADFVAQAGIPTFIDSAHAIAHNKVMLIDGHTIITGSFNFTTSAEKSNAENLLLIRSRQDLYQAYEQNFRHHYEHSEPYQPRNNGAYQSTPQGRSGVGNYPPANAYPPASNYPSAGNYPPLNNYPPANSYPPGNSYSPRGTENEPWGSLNAPRY